MSEKLSTFDYIDLVPRRDSILSLLSLRKFEVNQDLISAKRLLRVEGGREELGLQELSIWVSSKTI